MSVHESEMVDAFLAFNEIELAKFRLYWMFKAGISEVFIGEARTTFSGHHKRLIFSESLSELREFHPNVNVIELDPPVDIGGEDRWELEEYFRNEFLKQVRSRKKTAQIIFCDIDEIPSYEQIQNARLYPNETLSIPMDFSYRRANWFLKDSHWAKAKIIARCESTENIRYLTGFANVIGAAGQHASYLESKPEQLATKYRAFSHSELDDEKFSGQNFIDFCDKFGISHTGNAWTPGFGLLELVSFNDANELQREMWRFQPQWFDFATKWEKKFRIEAAVLSTWYLDGRITFSQLEHASGRTWNLLRLKAFAAHELYKITFALIRIRRSLRK